MSFLSLYHNSTSSSAQTAYFFSSIGTDWSQLNSVSWSCPVLCDFTDCSTPGFPVHHQLPELAQTHVHQVGDAIQSYHLSSPSPAFNLSQHQGLFQWWNSSPKYSSPDFVLESASQRTQSVTESKYKECITKVNTSVTKCVWLLKFHESSPEIDKGTTFQNQG